MNRTTTLTVSLTALTLAGIAVGTDAATGRHARVDDAALHRRVPVCNSSGVLDVPLVPTSKDPCANVTQTARLARRDVNL